jgi:hypothetical protein
MQLPLSFTTGATGGTAVLAYAAHVASSGDWGSGNSAGNINGSSYHNRIIANSCSGNISGCGQRDNQMATNAVAPAPGFSTQVRLQATGAAVPTPPNSISYLSAFYDSATITAQSASGDLGGTVNGTIAFFMCGPTTSVQPCTSGGVSVAVQGSSTISVTPSTPGNFRTVPVSTAVGNVGVYCFRLEFTSSGTNYSDFSSSVTTGECVRVLNTTSARLGSFKTVARAKDVRVKWTTLNELDVMGFNILRSTDRFTGFAPLNAALIPANKLGMIGGDNYVFKDKTAVAGKVYFYKLQLVGGSGVLEESQVRRVRKPPAQSPPDIR